MSGEIEFVSKLSDWRRWLLFKELINTAQDWSVMPALAAEKLSKLSLFANPLKSSSNCSS